MIDPAAAPQPAPNGKITVEIIETDVNGELRWTWSAPSATGHQHLFVDPEAAEQHALDTLGAGVVAAFIYPADVKASEDDPPSAPAAGDLAKVAAEMLAYDAGQFEIDGAISGSDLVDAFTGWRPRLQAAVAALENPVKPPTMPDRFSAQDIAAILTGLRLLQRQVVLSLALEEIATNSGEFEPLTDDEIDALCERINGRQWAADERVRDAASQSAKLHFSGGTEAEKNAAADALRAALAEYSLHSERTAP